MIIGQNRCSPANEMGKSVAFMRVASVPATGDINAMHKLLYGEN